MSGGDQEILLRYVSIALEMREQGIAPPVAEICREHPRLAAQVTAALAQAEQLAGLAREAQDFDALQGRVLAGRYRLERRIGGGAMGVVYRAADGELQRAVAVKILQTELFSGPEAEARFAREAQVLAALRHPSVVAVFDRGRTHDGLMFLVMELVDGVALAHLLADLEAKGIQGGVHGARDDGTLWLRQRLGNDARIDPSWLRQAVRWTADLATGLHTAHLAGVFHRDVKPSNVVIDREGNARLIDFGIAARASEATLAQGRQAPLGTPAYLAPEQMAPDAPATAAVDVYGLAATLYHLVTGRPPYFGALAQVIASVQRRDPVPAYRVRPGLPRDLQAILDRGMARDPRQRYPRAVDLAADLERFLAYQPVAARAISPLGRAVRRARRSPVFWTAIAAVVPAAAIVAGQAWRAHANERRAQQWIANWAQLPPALGLSEYPANRVVTDARERHAIATLLDAAVADAAEPLPARLVRATFRLDQGDRSGAAADMEAVARHEGSAFAGALAERYRRHAAATDEALALDGMPPPSSPPDHYLAAFHRYREPRSVATVAAVRAVLELPELADWPAALELRLFVLLELATRARRQDPEESLALFRNVHDMALRLEGLLGRRTATTGHLLGAALAGQQRFAEAIVPLRDAAANAPSSHAIAINLGIALFRSGALVEARACFERVIAARPSTLEAYVNLAAVHVGLGSFAGARDCVAAMPFPDTDAGALARLLREGIVEHSIAVAHFNAGSVDAAKAAAAISVEKLAAAGRSASTEYRYSDAIVRWDLAAILRIALEAAAQDPTSAAKLENVARALTPTLDEHTVGLLAQCLRTLARSFAPARTATTLNHEPPSPPTSTNTPGAPKSR